MAIKEFQKAICKNEIVYIINSNCINDGIIDLIISNSKGSKKIGLDMKNVSCIKSQKFINCLTSNKFKLFNLKSEVLTYLALILKDGFLKSHMNFEDFQNNKRELVKRRFLVA